MFTLCGLYFAQGVPWGFVTITLMAWLAQPKHGFTTEQLGPIIAVAALPWSFKFLWGPLMDRGLFRRFGRRRPWIIFAQTMAILTLSAMSMIDDLPSMVWTEPPDEHWFWDIVYRLAPGPLLMMIMVANIFVSIQDVAVDALAVDLLDEDERGRANGMMYGCSYLGTAVGGAGLGFVVARWGIRAGITGQAIILTIIMLLPIFLRERPHDEALQQDDEDTSDSVVDNLIRAFSVRSTLLGAIVAFTIKIGIGVLAAVFVTYLQANGWTQEEYTRVVGGYAVMLGLGGSIAGGFVADIIGAKRLILVSSALLCVLWVAFGLVETAIDSKSLTRTMLLVQEALVAVNSVALFSLFMGISWPKVAATQFTAYMAIMNFSTTIGSYLAAELDTRFTIHSILIIAGVLQLVLSLPVLAIDPKQTRRELGED